MLHALIGGVICAVWSAASGFVGGVWGSLVHDPPSNLGPLVGFGTGPLGLLFGGVAGVIIGLCCKRLSRLVAAVVLASIAYGAVCWLVIAYSEH